MRIVRLSDLSEEKRKKVLEEQEKRYQQNMLSRDNEIQRANNLFNEISNSNNSLSDTNISNDNLTTFLTKGAVSDNSGKFVNTKEFDDGYQFGDVTKTILGTGVDAIQDFSKGFIAPIENVADIGTNILATVQNKLGYTKEAEETRKFANRDLSKVISERAANSGNPLGWIYNIINGTPEKIINPAGIEIDKNKSFEENSKSILNKIYNTDNTEEEKYEKSSLLGEYPDQLNQLIGYTVGLSTYGNILSNTTRTASIGNSSLGATANAGNIGINIGGHTLNIPTLAVAGGMKEGLQEANSKENVSETERWSKAFSGGIIEGITEGLFGLFGVGGNEFTDQFGKKVSERFTSSAGKMLSKLGVQASGEAAEEFLSYAGNYLIDNGFINKLGNSDFSKEWNWEELGEQMALAFVSTGLSGGSSSILENNNAIKSAEKQLGRKLNSEEKSQVTQAIINEDINERLEKILRKKTQNKENNLQEQQSISQNNKMAQNQTSTQINDLMNNKAAPLQNYEYIKSENAKIDTLRQDANKYFVNNEKAKNYVSMLEKIITDKDVTIRLVPNLKDSNGKIANGSYSNGVITINPNSTRAGEFIAIHELTHAIGTKEMLNIVNNYRESNTEFDLAVKKLLKNYDGTEISEEALSDVAGQLFGNQEFINNLAQNNPSMFRQIYNEIKYLWHQFTGYKNQNQFIEDLQYKWEQAYRNNRINIENKQNMLYNANESEGVVNEQTRNESLSKTTGKTRMDGLQEESRIRDRKIKEIKGRFNEGIKSAKSEVENYVKEEIVSRFPISKSKTNELINQLLNKDVTTDDIYDVLSKNNEFKYKYIDDRVKSARKYINSHYFDLTEQELNELKYKYGKQPRNINIYNENAKKRIDISNSNLLEKNPTTNNKSIVSVDQFYEELSGLYPEFFDRNIANTADRTIQIVEFMKNNKAEQTSIEQVLSKDELKELSETIYNYKQCYNEVKQFLESEYNKELEDLDKSPFSNEKNTKYSIQESDGNTRKIQGLEDYDIKDLKNSLNSDIQQILDDNGLDDIEIVDLDLHGSRLRGTAKADSDLDVVVQYNGDIREDTLFDILNENPIEIDGIKIDINPIQENINDYMSRSNNYDNEILSKNSTDNKGRELSKEQQNYFKDSKVRDNNGNLLTMYHSTDADFNTFTYDNLGKTGLAYGQGFYFTDSENAKNAYGKNTKTVYLDIKKPMEIGKRTMTEKDYRKIVIAVNEVTNGQVEADYGSIDDAVQDYQYGGDDIDLINGLKNESGLSNKKFYDLLRNTLGYDGIKANNKTNGQDGNYWIAFNSNQIKNVNNTNPTDNPDIRYSKENQTWQEYLEDNYKATGTRTNLKEINFPTAANIERIEKKQNTENKVEIPKTKQDLLDNNSKAINKYIQEKNNSVRNIATQIEEYNNKLKSIQDKNSVEANKIKAKIIELTNKSNNIETLYNSKIDKAIEKGQKLLKAPDMTGRKAVIQKNRQLARERIENIADWKDKSNGFKYQRETMERNMFDIIPDKQEAQKMIDTYFEPVHESEANKQRFINKYNDKIKELNLNKYESEAVQLLGEEKYNPDFNKDNVADVLDRVTKNINDGKVDKSKVDKAIETFRGIYDELFDLENQALKENGYPEKPYRKGYFPHFVDAEPVSNIEKFLDKFGFKVDRRPLPTDIAGITEQFVPGKTWNRSALHRKTDTTTYNALKGFDTYISQAADNIFHTENIQKLRALENEIRYQYSEEGIQTRIDEIYNNDALTQDEQQAAIERIFEQVDNPMPNLVTELRRYTNALANKKSEADRSAEQKYGRQIYSTVNAIENRFGANAVGLNIGSAITNFIPITQAYSQVSTKNMGRAFMDTIKSYVNDDGFTNNSTFLTNRLNQSEKLYKTSLEKISDKTSFLFNAIDNVASNIVVRGKYLQNLDEGMSTQEAMKNADRFGANLMADRSKGSMPTLFNEKSPIAKAFTQFQLEVNNQYSYMFKDLPRDLKDKGIASLALAFFKMFVAAFLYNKASEEIVGRKPAFSPIDIVLDSYNTLSDENTSTADKVINVGKDVAEELPFVGGFLGGGRIPVSGALPDVENTFKAATGLATGEMDSKKATNTLQKELSKPLYYLLPPFGGGQLKKTVEGISTVANGGSYGVDSKGNDTLQFPIENPNAGDYLKAGLFGKYALDNAKEYSNRGYKSLNAKQTKIYKEAQIPYKELLDYIDAGLTKKEDKISYIENKELSDNQKWGIYKYDILSNTERKDGGSQLSDAEYMINHGMTKSQYIDMYNKAQKNNLDIPTQKEYKELKENGININNYMDYKSKTKESKKDKDKIQVLINSNYSNNEIKSLYESEIKNKNDVTYDIISKSGINIKEYLKYKQQEFESDKKDDGTTTGKTVSGSKKTKVYNYVNNMNISYNQKLLLLGLQYNLTSEEKTKLANYVNNMNVSKQDKLDIYEKFSGFTVYKDGRVTW